jgi:hypothetical protein
MTFAQVGASLGAIIPTDPGELTLGDGANRVTLGSIATPTAIIIGGGILLYFLTRK